MPSRRAVRTVPWWEVWLSLATWLLLGAQILRMLLLETTPADAVATTALYLAVGVQLVYGLVRGMR
jgi:hypothetical protein